MPNNTDALATERSYFAALLTGKVDELEQLLTDDFLLIDVMTGSEFGKAALLGAMAPGRLRFEKIEQLDSRERRYGATAIITGSTRMSGKFDGQPFGAHSRYTHVYVQAGAGWRLVTAQGTQIISG